ncbi:MAG: hypothetical protein AAGB11_14115 [Pseudomonadota bacterium]
MDGELIAAFSTWVDGREFISKQPDLDYPKGARIDRAKRPDREGGRIKDGGGVAS